MAVATFAGLSTTGPESRVLRAEREWSQAELAERLVSVLEVIYLIFNEGYSATAGDSLVRRDLCAEAIRLARASPPSRRASLSAGVSRYTTNSMPTLRTT